MGVPLAGRVRISDRFGKKIGKPLDVSATCGYNDTVEETKPFRGRIMATKTSEDLIDRLQAYEGELMARFNNFTEDTEEEEVDAVLEKLCIVQLRLMAVMPWQEHTKLLSQG